MFSRHLCSYIAFFLKDWSTTMVCTWYFNRGNCNIPLSTTHCCSNVSIERTESITLVIILYLIHLEAWAVLPYFWKHIYYLSNRVNNVGVFKFNILEDVVAIRCEWWLVVEMVVMLYIFFLLSQKTVCHHYLWCLHHSCGILGIQNRIVLIFVSNMRDRSCC